MKKLRFFPFVILICCMLCSQLADAQTARKTHKKDTTYMDAGNIITAYPLAFFFSSLKIGYEFRIGHKKSIKGLLNYTSQDNFSSSIQKYSELGAELQFRFYFSHEKVDLSGFYAAPFAQYYSASFKDFSNGSTGSNAAGASLGIGYLFGYQRVYGSGVAVDIYLGGCLNNPSGSGAGTIANNDTNFSLYRRGISPHLGIGIGLGF